MDRKKVENVIKKIAMIYEKLIAAKDEQIEFLKSLLDKRTHNLI
jgi:hypothetical protein